MPQRIRGGAAAQDRLTDALNVINDLANEIHREAIRDPVIVRAVVEDIRAVVRETLDFIEQDLRKILRRRDQAEDDDLRQQLAALEQRLSTLEARQAARDEKSAPR